MRVIFGIGNPGIRYQNTKHNVGFIVLDLLAKELGLEFKASNKNFYEAGGILNTSRFLLIKPSTYVNLSGLAVQELFEKYNLNTEDFLVITDDLNLELGKIRIRKSGGDGGHNGMISIINSLETTNFPRIRFGIGNNFETGKMADYVLSEFNNKELEVLKDSFNFTVDLVKSFVLGGTKSMLDFFSKNSSKINLKPEGKS